MPESIIIPSSISEQRIMKPTGAFTGEVYLERLHIDSGTTIANLTFTPCARTHWHTHYGGQMIRVISGVGWICDEGGVARRIKAGDTVWAEPGTTHWHGADEGSIMTHFVVGVGRTKWHQAVTEEEYFNRAQ